MSGKRRFPIRVTPCPIAEAVFEIRYESVYPTDAIFGIIYSSVRELFPSSQPQALPILQIPEIVRLQDPNLTYQPHHRIVKGNLTLGIGPKSIAFSNLSPYSGWKSWSQFFQTGFEKIMQSAVISKVERIGLRYINIFDYMIFDKIDLGIRIADRSLQEESTNLRTEIVDSGFIKVLQVANLVNMSINNQNKIGSVIDIDCMYNVGETADSFFKHYRDLADLAHDKEKDLFFGLLKDSFIKELSPEYEE